MEQRGVAIRTVTRSIETDAEPGDLLDLLADGRRIPEWAPAFADRVERDGENGWRVTKDGSDFALEVVAGRSGGTVDYLREIAPGRKGGAYLRVLPRPGGGSVVVMTLPVVAGRTAEGVAAVLNEELPSLVRLAA